MGFRIFQEPGPAPKAPHKNRPKRLRDEAHLKFIRRCQCLACGREPAEAAHVRYSDAARGKSNPGIGAKPGDNWVVPLCPKCHRMGLQSQHATNERLWWEMQGIDPLDVAEKLYEASTSGRDAGRSKSDIGEGMRMIAARARRDKK